jgi:cell division protein FtsI/penicillin-binding protein 2
MGAVLVRLAKIQIIDHENLAFLADRQQNKFENVKAERGVIKDRNGVVLSYTKDDISFMVDARMVKERGLEKISAKFSQVFGKEQGYYFNLIKTSGKNVFIEKKAEREKALILKDFVADGLKKIDDYTRVYPYGTLASHILGYVDLNCKGVYGIEKSLNEELTGKDGRLSIRKDVLGRMVTVNEEETFQSAAGDNVILTIDRRYQQILEKEIQNGLDKFGGTSAVGIIMNPNTGEILAMANNPTFDPNNYSKYTDDDRKNRIITDPYEPGSTFKAITMSIFLDNNLVRDDEVVNTENGHWKIPGATITDAHKSPKFTVKEVLEYSSNIGMAKLSERVDKKTFYKYLRDFGFGSATSVDLPGEANGFLKLPDAFSPYSKMYMSFGYEIMVTPLQLISAFSALVNGGVMYQPHVVSKVTDSQGNIIKEYKPEQLRRVLKEKTSAKIREYMVGVVEVGTGKNARLENVLVGGKTGSARKLVGKGYSKEHHSSSFVGFFPANNPKIVCLILFNSPVIGKDGGVVAAPVFKAVASQIIELDQSLVPEKTSIQRKNEKIQSWLASVSNDGGGIEYMDVPEKNESNGNKGKSFTGGNIMPDLQHKSVREVISLFNAIGLKYKVIGTGIVTSQSIEPGSQFKKGDICLIKCEIGNKLNKVSIN